MEGEVGRVGVEDRVVVAAAQLEGDFAGDGLGDPALGGFAQHDGLRVEPAALVEQAAELAAVVAVLLDGVLVVDAGDEALVGDEEQREAGGFVDAAGLGFDDAVLDLVGHAEAVAAADAVGFEHEGDGVVKCLPLSATGKPSSKRTVTSSGLIATSSRQKATPMMGSTIFMRSGKMLEVFGFVGCAEDVGVGGVGLLGGHLVGEAGLAA